MVKGEDSQGSVAALHTPNEVMTNHWRVLLNEDGDDKLGREVAARNGFVFVRKVYFIFHFSENLLQSTSFLVLFPFNYNFLNEF